MTTVNNSGMTWLALIPYMPAFTGWATISRLAEGTPTW